MSKKTLLIIAAIAVMLVGATSAYGYWEAWTGWFNSGYLTFLGSDTFDYTEGEGVLEDLTYGSVDSFFVSAVCISTFTCATSGPYQGCYIKLWPGASGWKYTGQRGQKEAHNGGWTGKAILYIPNPPYPPQTVKFDSVWGTWWSTYPHFNYNTEPDSYTAEWYVGGSSPDGLRGRGGSAGERLPEE